MAVPKNKNELIEAINSNYKKLKVELDTILPENTTLKELEGHAKGSMMSISNLVAYLVGWGELVLKWQRLKDQNLDVDFPETGYKWNELGKLAQKFYSDYNHFNYLDLCKRLDDVVVQILKIVHNTSNIDLYEKPWYDKWTQGKMIQLNTSSPYKNARLRVRKWKKSKNGTV